MKIGKNGQILNTFTGLIIGLVVIALVITVGFLIFAEAKTQVRSVEGLYANGSSMSTNTMDSVAFNATSTVQNSMSQIPSWLSIIVIVVVGSGLIGLVSMFRR